jgi:nucleoid-associated protein YgaU
LVPVVPGPGRGHAFRDRPLVVQRRQRALVAAHRLANRKTIGEDPNLIRPNQQLKLPYLGFSYHVEPGDTLWQLAEWVYDDGNTWRVIHQANPWIPDPDQIQASWWIWVP